MVVCIGHRYYVTYCVHVSEAQALVTNQKPAAAPKGQSDIVYVCFVWASPPHYKSGDSC